MSSSPEYTPSDEYTSADGDTVSSHYIYRPRWVVLCGSVCDKTVLQLREMNEGVFEQLEADLRSDLEFPMMRDSLNNFFRWINCMDSFTREEGEPRVERDVAAHRVELCTSIFRALQTRQQLLDREVATIDQAL
ncbi:hypothetical protein LIER_22087 [Lithospermum erythrorhizon]|uniref:Uncharacterized protein n=1 Tax=Lithospermum erythrorhizon TaxID=34254 RepID=A0AAV3QSK0_LITER